MAKETIFIESPCNIGLEYGNMKVDYGDGRVILRPVDDLGSLLIDHHSVHMTVPLMNALSQSGVTVTFCDERHMPTASLVALDSNYMQGNRFLKQLSCGRPLQKQLWKQIVTAKIRNQSMLLERLGKGEDLLKSYYTKVTSGDVTNREGVAAKVYWKTLFGKEFVRDRYRECPNNLLNYGYSMLRSATVRHLMSAGLYPGLGIFHHNCYNAFPLADDAMEPFRPFVDEKVFALFNSGVRDIDRNVKAMLAETFYETLTDDVIASACNSLRRVYEGESVILEYKKM